MINVNDPKWGWYLPRGCHRKTDGSGIHSNGPDGDLVDWQNVWKKWAEKWDEENGGTGCPTEEELKRAYDAFRNDKPKDARPPIDPDEDFDTSGGKNCWPKDRFGKCFGQGCEAKIDYDAWGTVPDKPGQVLEDCCGGSAGPGPVE